MSLWTNTRALRQRRSEEGHKQTRQGTSGRKARRGKSRRRQQKSSRKKHRGR